MLEEGTGFPGVDIIVMQHLVNEVCLVLNLGPLEKQQALLNKLINSLINIFSYDWVFCLPCMFVHTCWCPQRPEEGCWIPRN